MKLNIVLVEPEIPQNTGNISRTCAIIGAALHLVKPMGFSVEEKWVKRAGLDYWNELTIYEYDNLDQFFEKNANQSFYYFSTKASKTYCDVVYPDNSFLLFGKETKGLPENLIYNNKDNAVRIPMRKDLRSLNLSNAVAVAAYEVCRQNNFENLT